MNISTIAVYRKVINDLRNYDMNSVLCEIFLPEKDLHDVWLGLEGRPKQRRHSSRVLSVDSCLQLDKCRTKFGLISYDGVHEWGPASMVSKVDSVLKGETFHL